MSTEKSLEEAGPRETLQAEASLLGTSQLEFLEKERHQRKPEDCVRQCVMWGRGVRDSVSSGAGVCEAVCHMGWGGCARQCVQWGRGVQDSVSSEAGVYETVCHVW